MAYGQLMLGSCREFIKRRAILPAQQGGCYLYPSHLLAAFPMTLLLPRPVSGRQLLVLGFLLLPVACLAWTWSALPAQVPVHFTQDGADQYSDKRVAWAMVWLPLLVYGAAGWLSPPATTPAQAASRRLRTGATLFLSSVLCIWLVAAGYGTR